MKKNSIFLMFFLVFVCSISAQTRFQLTYDNSVYSEFGRAVKPTPDGGYIIAGSKFHHLMYYDDHAFLLKVDEWGQPEWYKKYGSPQTRTEASDVVPLADSGYLLLGNYAGGGIFTIRVDAQGDTVWADNPVTSKLPYYVFQLEKSEDDFIFAGSEMLISGALKKTAPDSSHLVIVKFDTSGFKLWEKVFTFDFGLGSCAIVSTSDENYICAGSILNSGNAEPGKIFMMKLNSTGEQVWLKYFNENVSWWINRLLVTANDEFVFLGNLTSGGNSRQSILLLKTDINGEILWRHEYGQPNSAMSANALAATDDGFILGGIPHFIKVDETGEIMWQRNYAALLETLHLIQTPDLGYAIIGRTQYKNFGDYLTCDLVLIKTDQQGNTTQINSAPDAVVQNFELFQNYPNPFNAATVISWHLPEAARVTLSVFNTTGQLVETLVDARQSAGTHQVVWNALHASSGVYFFKISAGAYFSVRKCVRMN